MGLVNDVRWQGLGLADHRRRLVVICSLQLSVGRLSNLKILHPVGNTAIQTEGGLV